MSCYYYYYFLFYEFIEYGLMPIIRHGCIVVGVEVDMSHAYSC